MRTLPRDFPFALTRARRAARRGDLKAAKEWTALVERHLAIYQRREAIVNPKAKKKSRPKDPTLDPDYRNPVVAPGPDAFQRMERIKEQQRQAALEEDD